MKKLVLSLFLLAASLPSWGTPKVALYGASPNAAFAGNAIASPLAMIAEVTGDASSSSAPINVYIPYVGLTLANEDYVAVNDINSVPQASGAIALLYFRNSLTLTNDTTDTMNLYVAASVGGSYKVIKAITTVDPSSTKDTGAIVTLDNSLAESICLLAGNTFCTNSNTDTFTATIPLFYFLDKNTIARDATITTTSYTGVYYNLKISANIPVGNIIFNELRAGESKLAASFNAATITQMSSDIYQTLIFNVANPTSIEIGNLPGASATNYTAQIFKRLGPATNATIDIRGLDNSVTYNIAIALMNKYQFVSKVSISRQGTPLKIENLLQSQACFLLTAGFGEEHWVIDYFKQIRDHFLAKFSVGRWFIGAYYESAPKYAMQIYHSPFLRWIIRSMAYVAYSMIHYFYLYFIALSLVTVVLLRRRRSVAS